MSEGRARSVLFDLDGTLTDPADGIVGCIRHALESLGAPVHSASRLTRCIGPPLRESFAMLLGHPGEAVVEEAVRRYRERFEARGMYENRVSPGIPELLGEIGRLVGDRAEDILGAQATGIASIGVTYGYGSLEELRAAGPTRICEDPASVLAALQDHYREEI